MPFDGFYSHRLKRRNHVAHLCSSIQTATKIATEKTIISIANSCSPLTLRRVLAIGIVPRPYGWATYTVLSRRGVLVSLGGNHVPLDVDRQREFFYRPYRVSVCFGQRHGRVPGRRIRVGTGSVTFVFRSFECILSDRSIDNSKPPRPGGSIINVSVRQYISLWDNAAIPNTLGCNFVKIFAIFGWRTYARTHSRQ